MTNEERRAGSLFQMMILLEDAKNRNAPDSIKRAFEDSVKALEQQPILEKDGTLIVTTEHYENVGKVLVQHGTSGTLFYQDHEPCEEREQGKCPFYAS